MTNTHPETIKLSPPEMQVVRDALHAKVQWYDRQIQSVSMADTKANAAAKAGFRQRKKEALDVLQRLHKKTLLD